MGTNEFLYTLTDYFNDRLAVKFAWYVAVAERSFDLHKEIRKFLYRIPWKEPECILRLSRSYGEVYNTLHKAMHVLVLEKLRLENNKDYKYSL